jgi:hypothetical protein
VRRNGVSHFGLRRIPGSLNVGESQDRLDDITAARVEVTPLVPAECATLILNCYETRLSGPVLFDDGKLRALFREPDDHLICLEAPSKNCADE